jgi:hypothetical protein
MCVGISGCLNVVPTGGIGARPIPISFICYLLLRF